MGVDPGDIQQVEDLTGQGDTTRSGGYRLQLACRWPVNPWNSVAHSPSQMFNTVNLVNRCSKREEIWIGQRR